jgi:hypothetical protein
MEVREVKEKQVEGCENAGIYMKVNGVFNGASSEREGGTRRDG